MAIRYYPSTKIKPNQTALPGQFTRNGIVYTGPYYSTYDGKYFSGRNPVEGPNEPLVLFKDYVNRDLTSNLKLPEKVIEKLNSLSKVTDTQQNSPISYYPIPTDSDYSKGYLVRYFLKMTNQVGYVMEISPTEYASIRNGTANYDVSFMQTVEILWKLTGPLRNKRVSQYDTRAGIIDTNQRLVENANKTFVGLKEFIGEDYAKFARPTE